MEIVRYDPEVSIPISHHGSTFSIGPLVSEVSAARVQVVHLPPGGLVGSHVATSRQLFAVLAGEGWASGGDGVACRLAAGRAAVWEPGESHEAGSALGLTAVVIEGEFDVSATRVTVDITVSDYDPAWSDSFEMLSARIWPAVADVALRIDHVGSTAVPGLAAKPVIDMDIVLDSPGAVRPAIERLAQIGYRWRGDLGIPGREAFNWAGTEQLPSHHLYLVVNENRAHLDHLLLRDLLRDDGEARERYAALKRSNAKRAGRDMEVYVAAKASFVAELLRRARAERGLPPVEYWEPGEGP